MCESVVEAKEESEMVKFKVVSRVPQAACVMHRGPYKTIGLAYGAIFKWMEDNSYELADDPREYYFDGIWNKDSEEDWLTEVQFPIQKKSNKY